MALGSVIQGVLGNPFGNAVSGPAFGVLNEFIGLMRSDNGYAKNNRFEVILTPPSGSRSQGAPRLFTSSFAPFVRPNRVTHAEE